MKKKSIFFVGAIIIIVIILALYSNTNASQGQKSGGESNNNQNLLTITITKTEKETTQENPTSNIDTKIDPNSNSNINTTTPERKLSVYLDKNGDGIKDNNEGLCTLCNGEQLLYGKTTGSNNFPVVANIKTISLDITGSTKESSLTNANIVWGVFDNKDFIVAPSQIAFGDGTGDNFIPAIEYVAKIAGINANISEVKDSGGETQYFFNSLIPIMQTSMDQAKTIYIKYSLNTEETKYYIASGKLTHEGQDYILKTNWNVEASLKSGYSNVANVSFYVK